MVKKYIVELESGTHIFVLGPEGIVHIGETDVIYETIDGMQIGDAVINAEPYTEPDLEQVRTEAYEDGYNAGFGRKIDASYQEGLSDAWKAARWIADATYDVEQKIFDCCYWDAVKTFTAAEAIEKIRQYEQEQENEFKVGDEFENEKSGKKFVVLKMNGKEIDRYIDVDGKTYCMTVKYKEMRKTGRHFPEIATVLEKMREGQEQ